MTSRTPAAAAVDPLVARTAGRASSARGAGRWPAPTGLSATTADLPEAIPFALEAGYDLLVLEGSLAGRRRVARARGRSGSLGHARRHPDPARRLNREEDIELLYFGGVRSGTDSAKLIGLGANAVVVGMSLALAVGGRIEGGAVAFYGDIALEDRAEKAELFLNALRAEASIMPRCTGKTDIHNLEPEDLRAISVATATAAGIPLAGFNPKLAAAGSFSQAARGRLDRPAT